MNIKNTIQNLSLLAASCLFLVVMLEVFLRFLPVNDGFNFVAVNAQQPVFHASADRIVTSSKFWNFYNARKLRINNAGFRNDQDYTTDDPEPLIASIGDSYVEAVQVDYQDTFYGRLAQKMDKKARVYSFGYSGAPLSQYLAWAQYATQIFKADHLNFTIISNDFDESLFRYRPREGFWLYKECENETYCLFLNDYEINKVRPLVKSSALLRYLIYNLQIMSLVEKIKLQWMKTSQNEEETYVANVKAQVSAERLADSKKAVDSFFRDLPVYAGLTADKITFVLDGRFYEETDERFERSYFGKMRRYFAESARARGHSVIDMKPVFRGKFLENGKHFESKIDNHWNALGHQLVSEQLYKHYSTSLD